MQIDWERYDDGLIGDEDYLDLETGCFVTGVDRDGVPQVPAVVTADPARYVKVDAPTLPAWTDAPGPLRMSWAASRLTLRRRRRMFARSVTAPELARQLDATLEDPSPSAAKHFQTLLTSSRDEAGRWAAERIVHERDAFWHWLSSLDRELALGVEPPPWLAALEAWRCAGAAAWAAYVEELLARLDQALRAKAPHVFASLRPGATDAQLADASAKLGITIPPSLATLYRWHDGSALAGDGFQPQALHERYWMAPLASLTSRHAMCEGFAADGTFAATGRAGVGWWDARWLPFLHDEGGGTWCVDLAGTFTGHAGQLLAEYHGDRDRTVEHADVDAWIETLVRALETAVIGWNARHATVAPASEHGPARERWTRFHALYNPGLPMRFSAE